MPATTEVQFEGSEGQRLTGRLHLPDGPPRAFALLAHCFTCGKDLRISTRMADRLSQAGFGVLRFDFTGLGDSEGEFAATTFTTNVEDLIAAAGYLRAHHAAPQLLIGHSLGGAAVLAAAGRIDESRAVATIAAPAEPAHLRRLLAVDEEQLEQTGEARVSVGGRPFTVRRALLDDLSAQSGAQRAATLRRALLVMHSPQDRVVGIDNASAIYQAARHPKSFISLDGADHLLRNPADAEYAADMIAAWSSRYLAPAQASATGRVAGVLASLGPQGLAVDVVAGGHRLRVDEPVSVGGTDTGPTPYDTLLASLGACTLMTLRMYAERKGWVLGGASLRLRHGRVHAKDCADCETKEGRIDVVERELVLDGALTDEQRARLLEIADRCPVHRTLTGEVRIRTTEGSRAP